MTEEKIYCSGGLYAVQGVYVLYRRVICCSRGLNAVQEGCVMFRGVICCSGGLYAVQEGYMDVQVVYMLKQIMMFIIATKVKTTSKMKTT